MDYNEIAKQINTKITPTSRGWARSGIWDRGDDGEVAPVHLALSSLACVVGDSPVLWATSNVTDLGSRDTDYEVTVLTEDLVVRTIRTGGALQPNTRIEKRSALTAIELLEVPLLTASDFGLSSTTVQLRLTYPSFNVVLRERDGEKLLAAIPEFIQDLE